MFYITKKKSQKSSTVQQKRKNKNRKHQKLNQISTQADDEIR